MTTIAWDGRTLAADTRACTQAGEYLNDGHRWWRPEPIAPWEEPYPGYWADKQAEMMRAATPIGGISAMPK